MKKILPLLLLMVVSTAFAQDLYVNPTGSDSNAGTQAQPFLTIQHAANLVKAGQTVHVAPGTYNVTGVSTSTSGTASNPIRFISDTQWGAHIVQTTDTDACWRIGGSFITIQGFDITEGSNGSCRIGIENISGNNVKILHNRIHDLTKNSSIASCSSAGGAGFESASDSSGGVDLTYTLDSNYIYHIGDYTNLNCPYIQGIYTNGHGNGSPGSVVVTNNVVFEIISFGLNINSSNTVVANNTTFHNGAGGIFLDNSRGCYDTQQIVNNIVFDVGVGSPRQVGISYRYSCGTSANSSAVDNLVFMSSGTEANNWSTNGSFSHTGDVQANPQFVSYTGDQKGDYHLKAGSAAIDAGTTSRAPATDFDDISRVVPIWIGAYQSNGSVSGSAPAPPTGLLATVN